MKLWDKGYKIDDAIERFTVGKDKELDLLLATHDILGTMAHVTMLEHVGLLSNEDLDVPKTKSVGNLFRRTSYGRLLRYKISAHKGKEVLFILSVFSVI